MVENLCSECDKEFALHDHNQEIACRQSALNRRSTDKEIEILNEGFAMAKKFGQ